MSDLVKRLKDPKLLTDLAHPTMIEAAGEIERLEKSTNDMLAHMTDLRSENQRLRETLRDISSDDVFYDRESMRRMAKAAIRE